MATQMLIAGKRKPSDPLIPIVFKDSLSSDLRLTERALQLGISKSELLREITHRELNASEIIPGSTDDPLLSIIKALYREARGALADGMLSAYERDNITDLIAAALTDVRTRKGRRTA